eukprot:gene18936-19274_t
MSSLIINAEAIPEAIPVESKSNEYNNKLASAYAPVATDSDTPVISFSNLSIEYVAASAIEAAGLQALSLGSAWSAKAREERINELLDLLEINHRRHVIVGDTRNKGISGGERKRLALAVELLTKPKLLFLDEFSPYLGLDSFTALSVIGSLKKLVEDKQCTVISSIHQPQTKIFELLENVILMSHGSVAYIGSGAGAVQYFTSLGYPLPYRTNPADHLIDVLSNSVVKEDENGNIISSIQYLPTWRRRLVLISNIVAVILVAIFAGYGPWNNLGNGTANLGKRPAVLFFSVIHQGLVYSYQGVHQFPLERAIMLRERQAGSYRVSAYFIGKTFADFVAQIPAPIIFAGVVYPLVGLNHSSPAKFQWFLLFMILSSNLTVVIIGISFEITRLFGGWFVSPLQLNNQYTWKFADALSYLKYAFVGVSLNEYEGLVLCNPNGVCNLSYANAQILKYGYQQYTVEDCAGYLCVLIIGFRFMSYLASYRRPIRLSPKYATGDLTRVSELRNLCGKDFLIFSGEDDSGCEFVRIGGDGIMSVTANVAPSAMHKMLLASKEGRAEEANAIDQTLQPLHKRLFLESNPIPVKKALQMIGKIGSGIRPPLCELSDEHRQALTEALIIGRAI